MSDKVIIDRYCPKCMSNRVYIDDDFYACRECGNRWIPNFKPITKTEDEEMAKKGCRNYGRDKNVIGDDLCGGCYFAVRGYTKGTPEYDQRLADAKKRFTDPNYNNHPSKKRRVKSGIKFPSIKTKKLSPGKVNEVKAHVKAIGIKRSGGDPDTAFIIGMIDTKIDEYKKRIDKLSQVKQILL